MGAKKNSMTQVTFVACLLLPENADTSTIKNIANITTTKQYMAELSIGSFKLTFESLLHFHHFRFSSLMFYGKYDM